MKKTLSALLCVLTLFVLFPATARADMGPKPSVVITFEGLEGETYYATLLSDVKSTGPFSALDDDDLTSARNEPGDKDHDVFLKFADYRDADGFYFLQFFQDCSQTQRFSWTYYPPATFKILLYFPEADRFVVSGDTYERYAFDSYYTANVTAAGITAERSYAYSHEILSLFVRIVLTVAVELGIALLFGFGERKLFRFIVLVNLITQIALNVSLNAINYHLGELAFVFFFALLEIAVFIVEAVLYAWYLKKHSDLKHPVRKAWGYSFIANAASFALGLGLAHWIPGIF